MARITLILIVVSLSILARCSDWKFLGTDLKGNTYYIDPGSILTDGDTRTFWIHKRLKKPRAVDKIIIYAIKSQVSINCTKRTSRILIVQTLDSKGNQVHYRDFSKDTPDNLIILDTIDDTMRQYVCSMKNSAE